MALTAYTTPHDTRVYTVTLTTANTKYDLISLLTAIDANVPATTRELLIQNDQTNGAAVVSIGNVNLSTTQRGYKLNPGESRTYIPRTNGAKVDLLNFYLLADTNSTVVNIELADF